MRTRIHRQILTELKTLLFYHSTFLTGGRDASRARLRDVHFLALCSCSFRKLCLPKPLPLLLGTGRTPRPQTRLQVPSQSAHPSKYPNRCPTTLMCCPQKDLRSHGNLQSLMRQYITNVDRDATHLSDQGQDAGAFLEEEERLLNQFVDMRASSTQVHVAGAQAP